MQVPVSIKGEIEVHIQDLPPTALDLIKSALSFTNEDKETAKREQVAGWWSMPGTIDLWKIEHRRGGDQVLVMPRGFAAGLGKGLQTLGATISWTDNRVGPRAKPGYFRPFLLRDYQLEAATDMARAEQGFFECPAGGGKTVTLLGLAAHLQLKTLVIVDKADLVEQWREEAFDFLSLGFDPEGRDDLDPETIARLKELVAAGRETGKIGQSTWNEKDLTIALRQTLWKRIDQLDPTRWWDQWGFTIYDEGHHIAADTLGEIVRRCISRHSIGASATPAKTITKGLIVEALIGPIVHRTSRDVLRQKGILIMPTVIQLPTEFTTTFWPTHDVEDGVDCMVEGCPKSGKKHQHRNNYSSALRKLVESKERNAKIAKKIASEPNRIHLVPSRQKKHLDLLKKAIVEAGWEGGLFFLRGEENARGESRKIIREIRSREHPGSVILSTVAEEALNIPPIDRVHVVFPIRQDGSVEQLVGRGERAAEGKDGCIVYDWVDDAEVFQGQAYARDNFYRRQGYPVDGSALRTPPVNNIPE